ncbi:MAG TPA: DUF1583 domain-containing protein [Pirellulaceae bacterium]|nr:DUF1583 domain-containing protein [Pirellulaceae bacterium]
MRRILTQARQLVSLVAVIAVLFVTVQRSVLAQNPAADVDDEVARQQKIVERFVTVLEKNPRRGTALDRIYGFHVEGGTLDALVERYRQRVKENAADGAAWMILGLVESQRGRDAAAAEAFAKATEALPQDAQAPYYWAQSLVLVGQPDKAVEAFELAISRKPPQNDLLPIFQALGRVHQRAQRTDKALEVWTRLEMLFPGDAGVQEQIAATLAEEGQADQALPRYEALAKLVKDDYRRTVFLVEAAELKVKLKRSAEGIADLEKLLATLNPASWLFRDVRRRIEQVFLRTDDQDGLAKYYEAWVGRNPEDVDAMARLARILARQARVPEAQQWLDKALKLAPSRKELRLAFIQQLVDDQRYADAIGQFELLDQSEPNNPDFLREWGKLILRDTSRPKDDRLKAAEAIWQRLVAARPKDPLIATQVADLLRHAEASEAALALYQKAVELAPTEPQYREYLGEFYHQLKRPDDALATWRQIASGKNRTAANLARLAEVLASFGYVEQSLPEIKAAVELDPKDFGLALKGAALHAQGEKYPEALAYLAKAESLAQNEEEREATLQEQIKVYQLEGTLEKRTADLAAAVATGEPSFEQLYLLARYQQTQRQTTEATQSIAAALKREPLSIPALAAAARIHEEAGELQAAADLNRKLATIDRRARGDYLRRIAQLESQLGRIEQAIQAGRDLVASAPGNTEHYDFLADLCFRLGEQEEGLQALRRAMRINPSDPKTSMTLADALAGQFRTDEAIELYWNAWEKTSDLEGRLAIVSKLAEFYLQTNHFDRLLERLTRLRQDSDDKREATICLAQAFHAAGDFGMARQELESLLNENTRDTQLLQQLSKLAETEGDLPAAVKYQEQLVQLAPGPETEYRLATLLSANGQEQESASILIRLTTREEDPEKLLRNLDSLLTSGQYETALLITEAKLREAPDNWELLYREGLALTKQNRNEEAASRFGAILALSLDDDAPGIAEKNRRAKAAKSTMSSAARSVTAQLRATSRLDYAYQVRAAVGLLPPDYYGSARMGIWSPLTFAQARMAALGWTYQLALADKKSGDIVAAYREKAASNKPTARQLWDWIYLLSVTGEMDQGTEGNLAMLDVSRKLALMGDVAGQSLFLTSLASRSGPRSPRAGQQDNTPPLSEADLQLAQQSLESVRRHLAASGGTEDVPLYLTNILVTEFRRAGRKQEEEQLFDALLAKASTANEIGQAISLCVGREDAPRALALFDKWSRLTLAETRPAAAGYSQQLGSTLAQLMGLVGAAKQHDQVLTILDKYLDHNEARAAKERLKAKGPARAASAGSYYLQTYYGKQAQRGMPMTFPTVNEYYDVSALLLLRNALEVFQRNDVLSDLFSHLQKRREQAAGGDKVSANLAVAYLHWWNNEREEALVQMAACCELAPHDWQLRMDLAGFHAEAQEFDEALSLIDAITPLDQDTMRKRETMALNLAVRLGDIERARDAAQRLFGLRLDPDTQTQLASQMRRLGMVEHAEAVMARAQRQAGNRTSALVTLMQQHQSAGNSDVALQIAHQILRRAKAASQTQAIYRGQTSDDYARTAALQTLAAAGKLKEMIAAAEEQLKRAPQSVQLHEMLAQYYQAAGDNDKSIALQEKMIELRGGDPQLRYVMAQRLSQAGKHAQACDQYLIALRKQPSLMRNNYWEVIQTFRQAQKDTELLKFFSEVDLKAMGQYYVVAEFVQNFLRDEKQRPTGLALFKRVWEAFPEQRPYLMSQFYNEELWKIPEVLEYGKQAILPTRASLASDPYGVIGRVMSYSSDGTANGPLRYILEASAKSGKLGELRAEITKAQAEFPQWKGGRLIAAAIDARMGKTEEARQAITAALEDKNDTVPMAALWMIGQEIEARQELRELVVQLYEMAMQGTNDSGMREFQYGPGPRLVKMYGAAGKKDEARDLLLRVAKNRVGDQYDAMYAAEQQMRNLMSVAQQLDSLELAVDAVRIYREALASPALSDPSYQRYGNTEHYRRQVQQGLDRAVTKLSQSAAADPQLVLALLAPQFEAADKPVIDLMLAGNPDAQGMPKLESLLLRLAAPEKIPPAAREAVRKEIEKWCMQHPADVSLRVVAVAFAIEEADESQAKKSLAALVQAVNAAPLEALPEGQRANARQRAAAEIYLGLWCVASQCALKPAFREAGSQLAQVALEAARRQSDGKYLQAMLHQQAETALAAGQREEAARHWTALIDSALARPAARPSLPSNPPHPMPPMAPAATGPSREGLIALATLAQFQLASAVALRAAQEGFPEVAERAMREALRGGLPVRDTAFGDRTARRIVTISGASEAQGEDSQVVQMVGQRLAQLSRTWRAKGYNPETMYGLLSGLVFPQNRPEEILLYPEGLSWQGPRSVGRELALWTVAARKADALRHEVAQRAKLPQAAAAGDTLLIMLALAENDLPAARQALAKLTPLVTQKGSATNLNVACHALALAMAIPDLEGDVMPLVKSAVDQMNKTSAGALSDPTNAVIRFHLKRGERDEAKKAIDGHLVALQAYYARYSDPNYAVHQQRQVLIALSGQTALSGDLPLTEELMGRVADAQPSENWGYQDPGATVARWAGLFSALAPAERYARLSDWTLPTANRRSVRLLAAIAAPPQVPAKFLPQDAAASAAALRHGVVSNLSLLVEAAQECGKLDELNAAADAAETEKLAHAPTLSALVAIARNDPAAQGKVTAMIQAARTVAKTPTPEDRSRLRARYADERIWENLLVWEAAMESDSFRDAGRAFSRWILDENRWAYNVSRITHVYRVIAEDQLRELSAADRQRALTPELKLWHAATPPGMTNSPSAPAWWTAHDGHLAHITGHEDDSLFFRYPLAGTFEFSCDIHMYDFSAGQLAYGGLVSSPEFWSNNAALFPVGRQDRVVRAATVEQRDAWNRYTVRVTPQSIRFYSNEHLVYEDADPSPTSPWLHLLCVDHRRTVFKNLKLLGTPEIPREIKLSHGDRLDGWSGAYFGQRLAPRISLREPAPANQQEYYGDGRQPPPDWRSEEGVLIGRMNPEAAGTAQGLLRYHRPLLAGDRLRYEFLYEPEKTMAHPAIGRTALLLEPEGVRLHWLVQRTNPTHPDLDLRNAIDDPQQRRGPKELPLEVGNWNRVQLVRKDATVELSLNDVLVYEFPLQPQEETRFGLFYYADQTEARVRNVVLRGNWPERLAEEDLANLLAPSGDAASPALTLARHGLVREEELADAADDTWRQAQALPAEDRYAMLSRWVLPSESHPTFRLQARFVPHRIATAPAVSAAAEISPSGSDLASPAMLLVKTAASLGKLAELEEQVLAQAGRNPYDQRSAMALKVAIDAAGQKDEPARAALKQLHELLRSLDPDTPAYERYPEVIAVHSALARPALRPDALAMAELLVENQQGNYLTLDWERLVRWTRACARWRSDAATAEVPMGRLAGQSEQWRSVSHPTAEAHGRGFPSATWRWEKGKVDFFTGQGNDSLYFAVPLQGNFEVQCQRSTYGWREMRILYGGYAIDPHHEGSSVWKVPLGRGGEQSPLPEKIPNWNEWVDYRLVVQEGMASVFINGVQVHAGQLPSAPDPWLAIQTAAPHFTGGVRNLKILGEPTIPDSLDLSQSGDLTGWLATYYGETIGSETANWTKRQDEIVGNLYANAPGSRRESVLYYHRPLLEDGEIRYQFFWEPGKTEIHPTLGRTALLLDPGGIKLHTLTAGAHERTGVAPDNAFPLPAGSEAAQSVPLRAGEWNDLVLTLKGEEAAVNINGQQVARFRLDSQNSRLFGLFRYSDATAARVRNVVYRGQWSRRLPSVPQQELAEAQGP